MGRGLAREVSTQARVILALLAREMVTRYGREGIGFLWVIGEPLIFCLGVIAMWMAIKPAYEHGVPVGAFVMTGYMSLLLLRHMIQQTLGAIQSNIGVLYHRRIRFLHVYFARAMIEFLGTTSAFVIVYILLFMIKQVDTPQDYLLLYWGWVSLAVLSFGIALVLSVLALRFAVVERLTQLFTYILIPLSGAFFTVSIIPSEYRGTFLMIPIPSAIEMVRAGVFGEFFEAYYYPVYPMISGLILICFGILGLGFAAKYVELD
ncbi:ABC transporter [Brevundimonas sp. GN22]